VNTNTLPVKSSWLSQLFAWVTTSVAKKTILSLATQTLTATWINIPVSERKGGNYQKLRSRRAERNAWGVTHCLPSMWASGLRCACFHPIMQPRTSHSGSQSVPTAQVLRRPLEPAGQQHGRQSGNCELSGGPQDRTICTQPSCDEFLWSLMQTNTLAPPCYNLCRFWRLYTHTLFLVIVQWDLHYHSCPRAINQKKTTELTL
jgi:hypothetical protein